MLSYDPSLTLVAVLVGVVNAAVVGGFTGRAVRFRRKLAAAEGDLASMLMQFITAITKLRVSGAESLAFERWAHRYAAKNDLDAAIDRNHARFEVVGSVLPIAALAVLFSVAGARASSGLSTGAFVAFLSAYGMFVSGLTGLVGAAAGLFDIVPLVERAAPILTTVPEIDRTKHPPGRLRGGVEVSRATFRYAPNGPAILSEIELEVTPGEFVAIVGPSGSGKSTLLRLLLGFERPESGGVYYDGQDLATLDLGEVRRQLGVVLQNGELDSADIFKNIVGTRNLTLEDAWEAARIAGLEEDILAMPMGMHTVLGRSLSISGGQKQRILIARAVVARPKILFLDEATSALDGATQDAVMRALDTFKATRIVIAHRLSTVRNANRIVVLEGGRVVQVGHYDELMGVPGPFRRLVERQA
jgi:ABC-type bacteriocin/lantibiotic exporter with double-glycine peptidase domain